MFGSMFEGLTDQLGGLTDQFSGAMELDGGIKMRINPVDYSKAGAVLKNMRIEDSCGCRMYMDHEINSVIAALVSSNSVRPLPLKRVIL